MSNNPYPNGLPGTLSVGERNTTPGEPYEIAIIANEMRYCPFVALPCGDGESGKVDYAPAVTESNARRLVACWNACRHLTTEQLESGGLDYAGCSTLADIRVAFGVGEKPMLVELAGIIRTRMGVIKILESDAKDHAAEIERLTAERNALSQECSILRINRVQLENAVEVVAQLRQEVDAAVRERDAAVEALRAADEIVDVVQFPEAEAGLLEILRNRVCLLRHDMRDPESIKAADNAMSAFSDLSGAIFSCGIDARNRAIKNYMVARAALAKIEGGRG